MAKMEASAMVSWAIRVRTWCRSNGLSCERNVGFSMKTAGLLLGCQWIAGSFQGNAICRRPETPIEIANGQLEVEVPEAVGVT